MDAKTPLRLRLNPLTARKLEVAAAIRGQTPSELVEWALVPHLAFALPELPDVDARPLPLPRGRAGAPRRRAS
jgi:hypothetical protein